MSLPAGLSLNSSTGALSGSISAPGSYSFVVTVTDGEGNSTSQTFTIEIVVAPTASVTGASSITQTSAQLEGLVNPGNGLTSYYFCYSTDPTLTNCTRTATAVLLPAIGDQQVTEIVTGLTENTTYYFTIVAWNSATPSSTVEATSVNLQTLQRASVQQEPQNNTPSLPEVQPIPVKDPPPPGFAQVVKSNGTYTIYALVLDPATGVESLQQVGWVLSLSASSVDGQGRPLVNTNEIRLEPGSYAKAAGIGFKPNTIVKFYLYSDPLAVGVTMTDDKGNFSTVFAVPDGLHLGLHTLQVSGYSLDGLQRTANLPVVWQKTATKSLNTTFSFTPGSALLTASSVNALRALVKKIPKTAANVKAGAIGYVYSTFAKTLKVETVLSNARAKAIVDQLKRLGLSGSFKAFGAGRSLPGNTTPRRVDLNITYEVKVTK
jgi:hypothetical protein